MIYLDLGRREMGKTTLAFHMVRRCDNRVIFDPRCQFVLADAITATRPDTVVDGFDAMLDIDNPARARELLIQPNASPQECFSAMMRQTRRWLRETHEPLALLIDEVTFVELMDDRDFEYLLRASPRQQLHMVLTGHRPKDIDVNIRAIADEWLMFRTVQEHDLKAIEERCGPDATRLLPTLAPYEFLQWDDARGALHRHKPLTNFAKINGRSLSAHSLSPTGALATSAKLF